ncbi:MAG: hypothetical protein AAB927_04365 [Patescibacteria group bacterium]
MNFPKLFISSELYKRLEPYRVEEKDMPPEYRLGARALRDDWFFFKGTTRRECYRRAPLPFRIYGDVKIEERWIPWDITYPTAPGTHIEYRDYHTTHGVFTIPHALVEYAGYGTAYYSAFLNGEWVPRVFVKHTQKLWGKRLSWYHGLHQDLHVSPPDANGFIRSDLGGWIEPPTASWIKEI